MRKNRVSRKSSADLPFQKGDLVNLVVVNRTVAEIAAFSEQFTVIGSDRNVRVRRQAIKEPLKHAVEIGYRLDLAGA